MYDELATSRVCVVSMCCYLHVAVCLESRAAERIGGAQGKYKKWPHNIDCGRGSGGMPPGSFTCSEVCSGGF